MYTYAWKVGGRHRKSVPTSVAVLIGLGAGLFLCQCVIAQNPIDADTAMRAALRELAIQTNYSRRHYRAHCLTANLLHVQILDPLLMVTLELDREKRDGRLFWSPWCIDRQSRYNRSLLSTVEPVVTIRITPDWGRDLGSSVGGSVTLGPARLLTSFTRMELVRNDIVVQPIRVGYTVSLPFYEYPPEAFSPDAEVVLRVWREDNERPDTMRLDERLLNSISRNFEMYSDAISAQ